MWISRGEGGEGGRGDMLRGEVVRAVRVGFRCCFLGRGGRRERLAWGGFLGGRGVRKRG